MCFFFDRAIFNRVSKVMPDCFSFALLRSVIGQKTRAALFNQTDAKLPSITIWSPAFSCGFSREFTLSYHLALQCIFLSSDWFDVTQSKSALSWYVNLLMDDLHSTLVVVDISHVNSFSQKNQSFTLHFILLLRGANYCPACTCNRVQLRELLQQRDEPTKGRGTQKGWRSSRKGRG